MIIMLSLIVLITNNNSSAVTVSEDSYRLSQMPETRYFSQYEEFASPGNTVVIYPILTQNAYSWGGIHDFYSGYCETCTEVEINNNYEPIFSTGAKSFRILEFLGYYVINDLDVDSNPEILKEFDTVIFLHNEYVTENEFNAISNHPNVIYLYPGSFESKVEINYDKNLMTLLKGPSFPTLDSISGFNWEFDNSKLEENTLCDDWEFYSIDNGFMLNCTPEYLIQDSEELLIEIKKLASL